MQNTNWNAIFSFDIIISTTDWRQWMAVISCNLVPRLELNENAFVCTERPGTRLLVAELILRADGCYDTIASTTRPLWPYSRVSALRCRGKIADQNVGFGEAGARSLVNDVIGDVMSLEAVGL